MALGGSVPVVFGPLCEKCTSEASGSLVHADLRAVMSRSRLLSSPVNQYHTDVVRDNYSLQTPVPPLMRGLLDLMIFRIVYSNTGGRGAKFIRA